jgi:NNP family nitrate/nitrite transporter-like MFS transporter
MGRWIAEWNPEDDGFWRAQGRRIARRNLVWSMVAENLGFSVWLMWSVAAARLPKAGFAYTTDQLFTLVALPGLVGALMRFPYTFAVPRFGGRNWTVVSALPLLVPTTALALLVGRPTTPFWLMALAASTAGVGGGNFASSMANISFFYPDREKGLALGLNAAGGNVGVSTVQLVVPLVVGADATLHLGRAGLMWMPAIVLAAAGAWAFMDNLASARSAFRLQIAVARRKHTWVVSWLYVGTFGSFVGYSAALPLLLRTQFPEWSVNVAFVGALVGSIARPAGGKLSDHLGGARVTLWTFVAMAAATAGVAHGLRAHSIGWFLGSFLVLFVATGIGNGPTFRMIPSIFRAEALREATGDDPEAQARAVQRGRRESAAVIGLSSALGALGGYFIPQAFGASLRMTGGAQAALAGFLFFYATCLGTTWWFYVRRSFLAERTPSLASAGV